MATLRRSAEAAKKDPATDVHEHTTAEEQEAKDEQALVRTSCMCDDEPLLTTYVLGELGLQASERFSILRVDMVQSAHIRRSCAELSTHSITLPQPSVGLSTARATAMFASN